MTTFESTQTETIPADPAWDEAFMRVEGYLRAHGLESRVILNRIVAEIIHEARTRGGGGEHPVALAMRITHIRIGEWFAHAGHSLDWADEQVQAQGRLALIIAGLPGRWADHFLSLDSVPAELAAGMGSFHMLPGPELRLGNMTPEALEFGLLDGDEMRVPGRRFWVTTRAAASWLLIFGFFGVAWAASH